jgi:V/A-type H+-transporting ATPase subunit E
MRRSERDQARASAHGAVGQGVQALRQAILSQAREQARNELAAAQRMVESMRQRAAEEAHEASERILESARREIDRERHRLVAAAELEKHREMLRRREGHVAQVFAQVKPRLRALAESAEYGGLLRTLICEAIAALGTEGGDLVVSANERDIALLEEGLLSEIASRVGEACGLDAEVSLRLGSPLPGVDGGVLVERADGRLRYDNTFAGRFGRSESSLRAAVYEILSQDQENAHGQ